MRSSDREIRLLDLLPGQVDHLVRCTTRVVSLNEHPDFETVSYVWGDRAAEEAIDVSGTQVAVTRNLHAGLLRLRRSRTIRTLWIDQICINQWDLEEKAAQVALMRDIYKQCTRCVTWMGELTRDGIAVPIRDAEAVFDFLRQAATAMAVPINSLPTLFHETEQGSAARAAFARFSMYGNPWWSRIWTVQEAITPPSGIFVWGPLSIPREDVVAAARNLRELSSWPSLPEGYAHRRHAYTEMLRRLLYPVHGFNHSRFDNALNLLMRWRHRDFTDPRDKVYALVGLITPDAVPSARYCDYNIAVSRLFARVTMDLIRHEEGLRPLLGACEMPQSTMGIPSWAIDFACCNRIGKRQLRWWGHSHRYRVFSACGDNVLELNDSLNHEILALKGVYVDEIVDTVDLLRVDAQGSIKLHELHEPLIESFRLLEQHQIPGRGTNIYKDGFTRQSAFCRTLVGDLIMEEIPTGRIASYDRRTLEAKFEELFLDLGVSLGGDINLDFLTIHAPTSPVTPVFDSTPRSYGYSPTSPSDVPRSPAFPSSSPLASNAIGGMVENTDPEVTSMAIHKRSDSDNSFNSNASVDGRLSHTSKRLKKFQRLVKRSKQAVNEVNQIIATTDTKRKRSLEAQASTDAWSWEAAQGSCWHDEQALSETSGNMGDEQTSRSGREIFEDLVESFVGMMENQTFFITRSGYIGIGPPQLKAADQVWVFKGGRVPFITRKAIEERGGNLQLTLVGDAYVHGIMDGEAMENGPNFQTVHIR